MHRSFAGNLRHTMADKSRIRPRLAMRGDEGFRARAHEWPGYPSPNPSSSLAVGASGSQGTHEPASTNDRHDRAFAAAGTCKLAASATQEARLRLEEPVRISCRLPSTPTARMVPEKRRRYARGCGGSCWATEVTLHHPGMPSANPLFIVEESAGTSMGTARAIALAGKPGAVGVSLPRFTPCPRAGRSSVTATEH